MRGRGIDCNEAKFFLKELFFHAHHVCKKEHKHKEAHTSATSATSFGERPDWMRLAGDR
jgi:hypothetical protein